MARLFGTDGIRGRAGAFPLDDVSVFSLGRSLGESLRRRRLKPNVLIGRDTRQSGSRIEAALAAGVGAAGGRAVAAGIVPTPAVSFLVRKKRFSAGVAVSASHNPFVDNGLKVFDAGGVKIAGEWEEELERDILSGREVDEAHAVFKEIEPETGLAEEYLDFLKGRLESSPGGKTLKLVLDCANGAAYELGPRLFRELGFEVQAICREPDGRNINEDCGSQHPGRLARAVVEAGADMGIALDGDADRAVWVDEKGRVLNGDHTLYVQGVRMKNAGKLSGDVVVATSMSNMGLEKALGRMGVRLERTRVGDKFVLEKMKEVGAALGGERSGHTIFLQEVPAGDGLLTSLKMANALVESGDSLSELVKDLKEYPQELLNIPVERKLDFERIPEIRAVLDEVRAELAGRGRLDVRYSGTENVARVMVEADDPELVRSCARRAAAALARMN